MTTPSRPQRQNRPAPTSERPKPPARTRKGAVQSKPPSPRRREFPIQVKRKAARRAAGRCELCTAPLSYGAYHYDHILPDALGGEPVLSNCMVLCLTCHRHKTGRKDAPKIAKSRRITDRALGIKPRRTITQWRKFNGEIVRASKDRR